MTRLKSALLLFSLLLIGAAAATACTISDITPASGEVWTIGELRTISWTRTGGDCGTSVRIDLYRQGTYCQTITDSAFNSGSYDWTVSRCGGMTGPYEIRVEDLATGEAEVSAGPLTIEAALTGCHPRLESPNGYNQWTVGQIKIITWSNDSVDCNGQVRLDLYRDGEYCQTITDFTPDDGAFTWTVTRCGDRETGYKVRITELASGEYDETDGWMIIRGDQATGAVRVMSPNGPNYWSTVQTKWLTWSTDGLDPMGPVRIQLLHDGCICRTITPQTENDGVYMWNVEACDEAGPGYRILISANQTAAADATNGLMEITEADAGCTLALDELPFSSVTNGDPVTITWDVSGGTCGDYARLVLLCDGEYVRTITDFAWASGEYTWSATSAGRRNGSYTLRLADTESGAFTTTVFPFTIAPNTGPGTVRVLSPNGNNFWSAGTCVSLNWTADGDERGENVRIDLIADGTVCDTLAESTPNDGEFAWIVHACVEGGPYRVRITDLETDASDETDGLIQIDETTDSAPMRAPTILALSAEPNPANPGTVLSFGRDLHGPARLEIYDLRGQLVRPLFQGSLDGSPQRVYWDGLGQHGRPVATGTYLSRLATPEGQTTVKIMILE